MTRLFRYPREEVASWASLVVFAVAYLLAFAFVLVPGLVDHLVWGAQ